ncbi:hypothetical protein [Ginsengibacter hankyongi]|uniref:hypothetical protein n=1 Tax=Ginsengibacter hankyongi TaxID=2607284 RepID=UPI0019290B53|nr:hypothetical protein [Ginsengibacter hankyongi]
MSVAAYLYNSICTLARTILMGFNQEWIRRQGDFFVESPINFLTAIIWFLRRYQNGEFCTLSHVIELKQVEYDKLFTVLKTEKEIEVLINPFVTAYVNDVMEQLEGKIATAKVAMARLSSPQLITCSQGTTLHWILIIHKHLRSFAWVTTHRSCRYMGLCFRYTFPG